MVINHTGNAARTDETHAPNKSSANLHSQHFPHLDLIDLMGRGVAGQYQ